MIESIFEKLLNKELPSDTEILYLIGEYYKNNPIKHSVYNPVVSNIAVPVIDYYGMSAFNIERFYETRSRMLQDEINELVNELSALRP